MNDSPFQQIAPVFLAINLILLLGIGITVLQINTLVLHNSEGALARVQDNAGLAPTQANPTAAQPQVAAANENAQLKAPAEGEYVKGNPNATITLIEYSDYECPFCQRFHATAQQAVDTYDGQVNWIYRHFPLSFHLGAETKAVAAECAGKLGGAESFWAFTDELFARGTNTPTSSLSEVASSVGLDTVAFQSCVDNKETLAKVQSDLTEGTNAGVTGTPGTFVYNNETGEAILVPGALPFGQLQGAIEQLL